MKTQIALCAALCALGCFAASFTVELPDGATNTLEEAISGGIVKDSSTGVPAASLDDVAAAEALRITGRGRLEINVDLKSANFAGEIHVASGTRLLASKTGALGDAAHGTFVEAGGTLETHTDEGQNKLDFREEPLTFEGFGDNGAGALVASSPTTQQYGPWGGTKLTLSGDASIDTLKQRQTFVSELGNEKWLDMNGHTLTLTNSSGWNFSVLRLHKILDPGKIVLTRNTYSINAATVLGGSAENEIVLRSPVNLELFNSTVRGRKKWTLKTEGAPSGADAQIQSSRTGGVWDGPFVAGHPTAVAMRPLFYDGTQICETNVLAFSGPMHGSAPITVAMDGGATKDVAPTFRLEGPGGTYSSLLSLQNVRLSLGAADVLPPTAAGFKLSTSIPERDGAEVALDDLENYALPTIETQGKTKISGGLSGSWAKIIKTGDGLLEYDSQLGAAEIDLGAGPVKFGTRHDYCFRAGLHAGRNFSELWYAATPDPAKTYATAEFYNGTHPVPTNSVALSIVPSRENTPCSVSYFTGYLMNNTSADATWRFASSANLIAELVVGGKKIIAKQSQNEVAFGNAVLKPGATPFRYKVGTMDGKFGPGSATNCETWTNPDLILSYCTNSADSQNSNDFIPLADPGDGSVLRLAEPGSAYEAELFEAWPGSKPLEFGLVKAAGNDIEIDRPVRAGELRGFANLSAGSAVYTEKSFEVAEKWLVDGASVAEGGMLSAQGVDFRLGDNCTVEVANVSALGSGVYAIAHCPSGISLPEGATVEGATPGKKLSLKRSEDGESLLLSVASGLTVIIR